MIRAIITGATGMVGEGVLYECLRSDEVEAVLVVSRKPCGYAHPKLKEVIHQDFFDVPPIAEELKGYNTCYFCLGVTSVGKDEAEYTRLTYDLTMHFCSVVAEKNPGVTICYVSGAGTSTGEDSRLMWARVKGKTENHIIALPDVRGFAFRPGIIRPTPGLKYAHKAYSYFRWLFPLMRLFSRTAYCSLAQIGRAMIYVSQNDIGKNRLEVADIIYWGDKINQAEKV